MDRHRQTISRSKEGQGRTRKENPKENPLNDTVYLIQNENDVLRMKNDELSLKIKELKVQLQVCTDNIVLRESEIEHVHNRIKGSSYKEDIQIENEKKLLLEKLALLRSNEEILLRKIREAREATLFEQQKIADIHYDKKGIEMEILSMRAQNEGTKIILRNLEEENERLREENEKLVNKRRVFEPRERELSIEIEERIRLIKSQQHSLRNLRIYETSKLIEGILSLLLQRKLKGHLTQIHHFGLNLKIIKKKVFHLSLIRRNYTLFIKNRVLQQLRCSFRPLLEQDTARRIISETRKRRAKAMVWRRWRRASKEAQYRTIRRFQFNNLLEKLSQSLSKCNLYSAFSTLKFFRNNPFHQRAALSIHHAFSAFMGRSLTLFFSALRSAQNHYEMGLEIEASSREQTEMLIQSLYFTAWCRLTKCHKIQNKSIVRRYFKELKKLLALKNRRRLGEMLMKTNDKIKNVDHQSKIFTTVKREALATRIHNQHQEHYALQTKSKELSLQLQEMRGEKKELYQQLSLVRVSKYLKRKMQKAFDVWRLRKQQSKVLMSIMNTIQSKKTFDKNFAFCRILKKRFFMLKKSIRDKIQSCEFSYNYLLEENKHIKEVLDKKQHELEKTKFTSIIKRILRAEKNLKLTYFYRFLKNGFKYWNFRKTVTRIDKMVEHKVKLVFMWVLKTTIANEKEELRIENAVVDKERNIEVRLMKYSLHGFRTNVDRNRRLRRVMGGIFQRNLQLDSYLAFGKIRNEQHIQNRGEIQKEINQIRSQTDKRNAVAVEEEERTKVLTGRLKDKEEILEQRKILTLYLFFTKSIVSKVSSYIHRWKKKVQRQKKVASFAQILQRKSRVLLKNKFLLAMHKKNEDFILNDLKDKLKKYQHQYEQGSHSLEHFVAKSEGESARMKEENQANRSTGESLQKKTDFMTNIKIKSFTKAWSKKLLAFCFKYWRQQTDIFISTWSRLDSKYSSQLLKESFVHFVKEMQYTLQNDRIRKNLSRIYHNSFLHNAGMGFRVWRFVYLHKKNQLWSFEEKRQMKRFEGLEEKYRYAVTTHNRQVDFRLFDSLNRSVFNEWRKYAQTKRTNKHKHSILSTLLLKAYSSEYFRLLKQRVTHKIDFKARLKAFQQKWREIRMKAFMTESLYMKIRRKLFQRLFVHKFLPFLRYKVFEEFFTRVKNFNNSKDNLELTDRTGRIQKVIETFQKKRKSILNANMRIWRRNQYVMRIEFNLLKRVTKNAMNWRVRDVFYSWKLQSEAKKVKVMHEEEGEVKKRKIEIARLKLFLEDFKKEKGLLLENEAGQLVVSPRFQEKKEQQVKKDNNLRYKFISRLILAMNGYSAPLKAYNNLRMYMLLREKYRKNALFARNTLRRPELYHAFRVWRRASREFSRMFEVMERKELIKILNRQKDKMEMEYSKKCALEESILEEMKVHKVLAYQEDRKEKLCAHVFLKNLRKVQLYALLAWKQRLTQLKQAELAQLEEEGSAKIGHLEEEVNDLEDLERELRDNNEKLELAVQEALEIAEMVKRITEERDILSSLLAEKQFTCESLQEENEDLNAKLHLAQKEAMNLLILSGERL